MLSLGALSFAAPWALAALATLPVIWWLLRLTPPAPQRVLFPPIRLLLNLASRQESTVKSPLWLLILRLVLAGLVILAAAHPLFNAATALRGGGPLVLFIDDGWAAGREWASRETTIGSLLDQAERQDRQVLFVTTAPLASEAGDAARPVGPMSPAEARLQLRGLQPKPWPGDHATAVARLQEAFQLADLSTAQVAWLSDGLDDGTAQATADALGRVGSVTLYSDAPTAVAHVLRPPVADGAALRISVTRASGEGIENGAVLAYGEDGTVLGRQGATFAAGERTAQARFLLPAEVRNRLTRLQIENEETAAAVVLIDERWRRRPVGLVSAQGTLAEQPLLGDLFYLERALAPFTEIRKGSVDTLLERQLAVIVLADPGVLADAERKRMETWIAKGGMAVRFAGPRLAQDVDGLLPVRLRPGDRILEGALAWGRPATLAAIDETSPLHGIRSTGNIRFRRQVLAEPSIDLAAKTWARLSDGTPLVTAERRGEGWLILVHTTANTEWSDLALSGVFVEMLRKFVNLSQGIGGTEGSVPLPPMQSLDGFGRIGAPPAAALPVIANELERTPVGPRHPPGYYGEQEARRALNLSQGLADPQLLPPLDSTVTAESYGTAHETDARPWLLLAALILAVVDLIASLGLRRLLYVSRPAVLALLLLPFAAPDAPAQSQAQTGDAFAMMASLTTRLAYVLTGDSQVDDVSQQGLRGLGVIVNRRTAAEMGEPVGISPERDELSFFPLIYWPMTDGQQKLSAVAADRINAYMRNGGTVLFDTRDGDGGEHSDVLRRVGEDLDLPPLVALPEDHVLGRAYYLLRDFPGRYTGGPVWVERTGERINDGVSSVIVGSSDWAAAWAMNDAQQPLFAVVPGGERQREFAYRVGINMIMYTLTGNYKADQVHLPAIINRLGE